MTFQPADASSGQWVQVGDVGFQVQAVGEHRRFWNRINRGEWEPQTFRVFRRFLDRDSDLIDIGAWIGPTALFAAHLANRVHAIEPDPAAGRELAVNVAANPAAQARITIHNCCIAPQAGPVSLYTGGMYYTEHSRFGDSMSGLLPRDGAQDQPNHQVEGVILEDFMAAQSIGRCGLIKMDVEGGEYVLIPGQWRRLAAYGMPPLYVSFHEPPPARRQTLIGDCLTELATCYRFLYSAADQAPLEVDATLAGVGDWNDLAADSAWTRLDRRLGDGLVASNQAW